ncbi:sodium-coupled neutral amino acid transporter 9 isoform X2 [Myotis lucifugus]|uniref:sodium-coupled neutral amino acid transporter 9 isoform X2 n=1 Tax=Myotis lucifugus TaxID=59463 RepID=UPI000CCC11F6|nr:sodium-coupled neutral amino acid transporter 9 isoform X2 [Myotis lucifugus]
MADLDSDSRQLLAPEAGREVHPGPMNIQFDSSDLRPNRPFHVEPTNIVSVSDALQRVSDRASAMNKRIHYYSRLAAPADQALVAPDHVVPAPEERYVYSPLGSAYKLQSCPEGSGKNTSLVTIFMIWNTMMGTSILSIPWGIKQAGFTTGVCVILLMGLLTLYCCYRVLRSRATIPSVDTAAWEFPDVCRHYFGAFGQWSSLLFSLVSLIGAMVVYWVLMSNFLFNTGKFMFNFIHHINDTDAALSTNDSNPVTCPSASSGRPDNGSAVFSANATGLQQFERWWDKSQTVPFYLVGLLLPLLNFKSPSFFSKFNVLGTVSIAYLTFLVTLKAARLGFHLEFHWFTPTEFFVPEIRSRFPQLTGVLTLAFFIHNCVITLLKNNKNQENNVLGSRLRPGLRVRLPVPHLHPLPPPRGPPDVALAALPRPPHRPGPGQPGGPVLHVTLLPRPSPPVRQPPPRQPPPRRSTPRITREQGNSLPLALSRVAPCGDGTVGTLCLHLPPVTHLLTLTES